MQDVVKLVKCCRVYGRIIWTVGDKAFVLGHK